MAVESREKLTQRNRLVDALRGLGFVLMTMDHLPANLLRRFSNPEYGPFGFFTAASGFVFLSGLVSGMVYERYGQRYSPQAMVRQVWRRCRAVYCTHIALYCTLLAMVVLHVPGSSAWHLDLFSTHPWRALWLGITLLHEPSFLGILPMYCVFLALTPLVLWAMRGGYLPWVLGGSVLLWIVAGLGTRLPADPDGICFGAFHPLSYQLLFCFGLAFGAGHIPVHALRADTTRRIGLLSSGLTLGFFVLRMAYALSSTVAALVQPFQRCLNTVYLGPVRVLNFAVFGVMLYWLSTQKYRPDGSRLWLRGLAFLGEHSLPVFTWSLLTTYLAMSVLPEHPTLSVRACALVLAVASLLCPAFLHAKLQPYCKRQR